MTMPEDSPVNQNQCDAAVIHNLGDGRCEPNEDVFTTQILDKAPDNPQVVFKNAMMLQGGTHWRRKEGSTSTAVYVAPDKMLYAANVGDSPSFLVAVNPNIAPDEQGAVFVVPLAVPHHASNPDEAHMIPAHLIVDELESGTKVLTTPAAQAKAKAENKPLSVTMQLTRTIGDCHFGLSSYPDFVNTDNPINVSELHEAGYKAFAVLGSDGIHNQNNPDFQVLADQYTAKIAEALSQCPEQERAQFLTQDKLAQLIHSSEQSHSDDTTLVVKEITPEHNQAMLLAVNDGHGIGGRTLGGMILLDDDDTIVSHDALQTLSTLMRHPQIGEQKMAEWARQATGGSSS